MIVLSINLDSNKYFKDHSEYVEFSDQIYNGSFRRTPIYPLYTFSCTGRFTYMNDDPIIEFYTMLPITRSHKKYLVEVIFRYSFRILVKDSLIEAINEFHNFCTRTIKDFNVESLVLDD